MKNLYSTFKSIATTSVIMLCAITAQAQVYCIPVNTNSCGTAINPPTNNLFCAIRSFSTTGGIVNITNNNQTPVCSDPTGYKLWNLDCKFNAGATVNWSVTGQSNVTSGFRIWVDWNRDGLFTGVGEAVTPGSLIFNGSTTLTPISFTVPGFAKQGVTRMRIRTACFINAMLPVTNMDPCIPYYGGETEDYNFEVVNPCLPPAVTSIANVDWRSADFSWQPRPNAIMYEYTIDQSPADPVGNGYAYTTQSMVRFPDGIHQPLSCNTKYYVHLRSVCDDSGPTQSWDVSSWTTDQFTTDECCYAPEVTLPQVGATTALAKWGAVPSVVKYEYAVGTTPNNPPLTGGIITSYPSIQLQGLNCNSVYYFYLRALCAPTPLSDWNETMFVTEQCLGIEKINPDKPAILAYPNPVSSILTIALTSGLSGSEDITLTDINGRVVRKVPVTGEKTLVDMSDLPAGLYLVKYKDDHRAQVVKITKQ